MSDRVQEIIEELILTAPLDDIPSEEDRASAVKQIRQQIGRELLGERHPDDDWRINRSWLINRIREVCQLEEE